MDKLTIRLAEPADAGTPSHALEKPSGDLGDRYNADAEILAAVRVSKKPTRTNLSRLPDQTSKG